jgi:hypothetical protein
MMYLDGRGTAVDVCQAKYFLEAVQSDSAASRRASVALQRIAADGTCPDSTSEEMTMLTLPEYAVQREYQRSMISKRSVTFELPGNRRKADVEAVFEQNRKALYLPYARALHDDKTLQGKVQFEMTISPAGEVVACKVISTTMNHPQLEERLVNAIRSIRFPAAYVFPLTLTKPIEFFPSN